MNISKIQPANSNRDFSTANEARSATNPVPATTALIPVAGPTAAARTATSHYRPDPAFVAHLIAIAQQSPQTRNLRRASLGEAHGRYEAARPATPLSGLLLSMVA